MSRAVMLVAFATIAALNPMLASAQAVGAFVFPKTTPAQIKVGDEVAAEVTITDYLIVQKAEGEWLWVESRDLFAPGDEGKKGWIAASSVDDLETQINYFVGKAAEGPGNATGYFLAGAVTSLNDDDAYQQRALNYFSKAIELDPKVDYYYQRRASCWVMLDNYGEALKDLGEAGRIDPSNEAIPKLIETVRGLAGSGTAPPAPSDLATSEPPSTVPAFPSDDLKSGPENDTTLVPPFGDPITPVTDSEIEPPREFPSGGLPSLPSDNTADDRVRTALTEAGLDSTVSDSGDFRVSFTLESGRSQAVFVGSKTESLGDFEIREIWSPIGVADGDSFSQAVADQLLRVGALRKIGSVEVATLNGKPTAYYTAKVPADLSGSRLGEVIRGVASIADNFEQSLFKSDGY